MKNNTGLTLGSLFDGSGGFPLGGLLAGITPIWSSEIEPFTIRVTTKRLPQVKHYGDISKMNGADIEPVDIITFGSPCQDLSVAGKRDGLGGARSGLFYEAVRIIKEMRYKTNGHSPRFIVWENVPGAFSSNKGEDFRAVLEEVSMSIFQPRRENVSTWTISVSKLKNWAENVLRPKAQMAMNGEGEFYPGDWCTFCRAAVRCRARAEEKLKLAQEEFKLLPLLSDEEIESILTVIPDLTKWAKEIMVYATEAAVNHGKEWRGFKLVEGRSVRKYKDENAVAEVAKAAGYKDIYRHSLITLTEMQKLMGKENFEDVLGDLIIKPPGKPTLVPITDKREAIKIMNINNEFNMEE